jgi:hypothetical protein
MWQQLSDVALQHGDVIIAERCAAALGDVPRAAYLHAINATVSAIDKENNTGDSGVNTIDSRSKDHWSVRYKMCLLRKDMRGAEDVLMSQGKLQEAIDMYHKVCAVCSVITMIAIVYSATKDTLCFVAHGTSTSRTSVNKLAHASISEKQFICCVCTRYKLNCTHTLRLMHCLTLYYFVQYCTSVHYGTNTRYTQTTVAPI